MSVWLNGQVLCEEARCFIQIFLSVAQMRPDNDSYLENCSDDVFSDEELHAETHELEDVLVTRLGTCRENADEIDEETSEKEMNVSKEAMQRAGQILVLRQESFRRK